MSEAQWRKVLVTPAEATAVLARSGAPSRKATSVTQRYARDMASGAWALNGEALIFDGHGNLLDGFQRLRACVRSDAAFPTFMVAGVAVDAAMTIDAHRKRRVGDSHVIDGRPYGQTLAAAVSAVPHLIDGASSKAEHSMDIDAQRRFLSANDDFGRFVEDAIALPIRSGSTSTVAAMLFLMHRIAAEKAETFLKALGDPDIPLTSREPGHALARALAGLGAMKSTALWSSRKRHHVRTLLIKAWNAHYDGAKLSQVNFSTSEGRQRIAGYREGLVDLGGYVPSTSADIRAAYVQGIHDSEVSMELRLVTPVEAEAMLERNGPLLNGAWRNRNVSMDVVARYGRDMESGRWLLNGQAIKLSDSQHVLDGQHRLMACARFGHSFETMVVTGLPDQVFTTYDRHSRKQFHRVAALMVGQHNATTLQSALRLVWRYENHGLSNDLIPTNLELNDTLDRHGESIRDHVKAGTRVSVRKLLNGSTYAAARYILESVHGAQVTDEFFMKFETGSMLPTKHPILLLRDELMGNARNRTERQKLVALTRLCAAHAKGKHNASIAIGLDFEDHYHEPHMIVLPSKAQGVLL